MSKFKSLAHGIRSVSGKTFEKKFVALGRVLDHWEDIVGADMSCVSSPVAMKTRKSKGEFLKILEVGVSPSFATKMHYKKGLIMERIERILGQGYIYDVVFKDAEIKPPHNSKIAKASKKELTSDEKNYLSGCLGEIEDSDLKDHLAKFGQSLIQADKGKQL